MTPPPATRTAGLASPGAAVAVLAGGFGAALLLVLAMQALFGAFGASLAEMPAALVEALFALFLYGGFILLASLGGWLTDLPVFRWGSLGAGGAGCLFGVGAMLVALTGSLLAQALKPGTAAVDPALLMWLPLGAAMTTLQVAGEEILFRGWLQPLAQRAWGATFGVIAVALGFALMHLAGGAIAPLAILNLLLGGLLFGLLAWRTGGLLAPLLAHLAWNGMEALLFGLVPNPGVGSYGALVDLDLAGPALLGGSEHGLNDSVQMTAALFVALAGALIWMRLKPKR